jgi:histidine triad (HIT) family protein
VLARAEQIRLDFSVGLILTSTSMKTLFEKIIAREIPANIEYEDDQCIVIHDIDPKAPTHFLVIPKKVIPRLSEANAEDVALLGHVLLTAASIAKKLNLEDGFRVVINNGAGGGEVVPHLHVHVLGGRRLKWPPG